MHFYAGQVNEVSGEGHAAAVWKCVILAGGEGLVVKVSFGCLGAE
jgi:hypothetical protein